MHSSCPAPLPDPASTEDQLREILVKGLGLAPERVAGFGAATGLFGHLPEFDSMAVPRLLAAIEDRFGIMIEDDELSGDMLESWGALVAYVHAKRAGG